MDSDHASTGLLYCRPSSIPGAEHPARSLSRASAACPCLLQGSGLTWSHHGEKKLDFCDVTLLEAARRDSDPVLREFLRLLALCHTVMVEEKGGGLDTVVDVLGAGSSCRSRH